MVDPNSEIKFYSCNLVKFIKYEVKKTFANDSKFGIKDFLGLPKFRFSQMQAYHKFLPFLLTVRRGKNSRKDFMRENSAGHVQTESFYSNYGRAFRISGQGQLLHPFLKLVLLRRNSQQHVLFRH